MTRAQLGRRRHATWFVALFAGIAASFGIHTAPAAATSVETRATYHSLDGENTTYAGGRLRCSGNGVKQSATVSPDSPFDAAGYALVCSNFGKRLHLQRDVQALSSSSVAPPHHLRVTETFELWLDGVKCATYQDTRDLPVPWDGWSWTIDLEGCGIKESITFEEWITTP